MQIGKAVDESGVSAKKIRHYETIGLLPVAGRRESGYRDFSIADIERLRFIRRARNLGFSIDQIRTLLRLWSDEGRSNAEVKALALAHVRELDEKVRSLREMSATLKHLAEACDGDGRPDCPILSRLDGSRTQGGRAKANDRSTA